MKRTLALMLCILAVVFAGCSVPSEQMAEEDIRKQIVADNACLELTDDAAGAAWLLSYLKVENAEMSECFRTDDMSDGFELCFSKWSAGQREYMVSEVVYEDGKRYLCDLYELTGVTKLHTLAYAYERVSADERFSDGMVGVGSNGYSDGILEVNITSEAAQTMSSTLLVDESIAAKQILYGIPSDGSSYTVKVVATVNGTGIRNVYMCNDERPSDTDADGQHLLNKTYYIGYSGNTGNFALVDRQYNETVLCEVVDTEDGTRRVPQVFGVWNDRFGVYTVSDNVGVVQVGVYDAESGSNTVLNTSGTPIGMYGGRLYLSELTDGKCTVGYISLEDPTAESVLFDGPEGVILSVAFAEDGRMAAVYAPNDGPTRIAVFDAEDGRLLKEEYIDGIYCAPKYAGFLEDGSLMVLCDKKLLCDEYLFIIGEE